MKKMHTITKVRTIQEADCAIKALRHMGYADFSDWIKSKDEGNKFYDLTPIRYWSRLGYGDVKFSASLPEMIRFNVLRKTYLKRYY